MDALIMAGGRGKRLQMNIEKNLVRICNQYLINWVMDAVLQSNCFDEIFVAISQNTPKTKEYLKKNRKITVVDTSGCGYIQDMHFVIKKFSIKTPLMVISADLPLLNAKLIKYVVEHYKKSKKPALSVMVESEVFEKYGLSITTVIEKNGMKLVPSGVNIISSDKIKGNNMLEEEILVENRIDFALNINTLNEVKIAEKIMALGKRHI
ncbi:MAG TPA: nucleotidyltransferase [Methanosarcinales archaeon]|nr:nucleotidyltransferase [Methanosarcinales archaeon]